MYKFLTTLFVLLALTLSCFAQSGDSSKISKKDSLAIMQELMSLLNAIHKPVSYFYVEAGFGNRQFGVRNNLLKTKQSSSTKMVYSPGIGYFNKSGFSISGIANILKDKSGLIISQFAITPAYDLPDNRKIGLSASYTRYFVKNKYSPYSSPVQNDLFASFIYKKPIIQPGLAVGYSTGQYNETYYWKNRYGVRRYDSVENSLKSFSVMLSAAHRFSRFEVFSRKDALIIQPSIVFNAGSSKLSPKNNTNATLSELWYINRIGRLPKIRNNGFAAESLGLNTDINYIIGKITLSGNGYVDYYLPATTLNRFTVVFTINFSYSF